MRYVPIAGHELDDGLIGAWDRIQSSDPLFRSPYLSPWFTRTVAEVRDDVFVTLLLDGDAPVGFFPHQRTGNRGGPVAGQLNDCQAVIVDAGADWSPKALLKGSGLRLWDFDHMLADQAPFRPFARVHDRSPVIELGDDAEAYFAERKAAKSGRVQQMRRKWRKLLREHGDAETVRFEPRSRDAAVLDQVIRWKLEQCLRTGTYPYFQDPWTVGLVQGLLTRDALGCSGALSVLWVGDEVAAAHFGMTSRTVWHWWFPTYSDAWSQYSPGGLLLLALCEHVGDPARSQQLIDLGKGEDPYKDSFANAEYPLTGGHVSRSSAYAATRSARRAMLGWARRSPLLAPARRLRARIRDIA